MLSQFVMGVLSNRGGELLRELASGTGFVDIVVKLGSVSHLLELKILRGQFEGIAQWEAYMKSERRPVGWLVVFDVRKPGRKTAVPLTQHTKVGIINVVCVDVKSSRPQSSQIRRRCRSLCRAVLAAQTTRQQARCRPGDGGNPSCRGARERQERVIRLLRRRCGTGRWGPSAGRI